MSSFNLINWYAVVFTIYDSLIDASANAMLFSYTIK